MHRQRFVCLRERERSCYDLAVKLRREGKITTPGEPFSLADDTEIQGLMDNGVLVVEHYDESVHGGIRVFDSRMVHEVKNATTDHPYEKSCLVCCGHSDRGKKYIITQSSTISRSGQRLLCCLTPALLKLGFMVRQLN